MPPVEFLDLAPLLPADADRLYFGEGHFNAAGHAFAAKAILRFLEDHGLAPSPGASGADAPGPVGRS